MAYSAPGAGNSCSRSNKASRLNTSFDSLCKLVAQKEFDLHINLNLGKSSAVIYAADLTEEYVEFNKGDVSDPTSLGG